MDLPEYKKVYKNIKYSSNCRYKNTPIFVDSGQAFRCTYEVKDLSQLPGNYTKVLPMEEGRLDLVALRVYKNPKLFWAIAQANEIIDVFSEVVFDKVLYIPSLKALQSL